MIDQGDSRTVRRWAGPALFIATCVLVAAFFWWFVQA
jgi:hypothetical protein